jgi:hypothetical protein
MRRLLILGAAPLLSGCSPANYTILVSAKDGVTIFTARPDGMWPLRDPDNAVSPYTVTVRDGDRVVWRIESNHDSNCLSKAGNVFPLTYGELPDCFTAPQAAIPLEAGRLYQINSWGIGRGEAYFRAGSPPVIVEADQAAGETARWAPLNAADGLFPTNDIAANEIETAQ